MRVDEIPHYLTGLFMSEPEEKAYRVIVPLSDPATQHSLIRIASSVAARNNGELLVMSVVENNGKLTSEEIEEQRKERLTILEKSVEYGKHIGVRVEPLVFTAERASDIILTAVRAVDADLLLMGWKRNREEGTFDTVLKKAKCDVAVLMDRGLSRVSSILVPYKGGFHAEASLRIAGNIAYFEGARIRLLNVEPPDSENERTDRHGIRSVLEGTVERTVNRLGVRSDIRVVKKRDVVSTIIEHSEKADLLIMSAGHDWRRDVELFGGIAHSVARESHCSVLLVRKYESPVARYLRVMYKRHLYIHGRAEIGLMGLAETADSIEELEALKESHENYLHTLNHEKERLRAAIKKEERSSARQEMERQLRGLKGRIDNYNVEIKKIDNLIHQRKKAGNERIVYGAETKDDEKGEEKGKGQGGEQNGRQNEEQDEGCDKEQEEEGKGKRPIGEKDGKQNKEQEGRQGKGQDERQNEERDGERDERRDDGQNEERNGRHNMEPEERQGEEQGDGQDEERNGIQDERRDNGQNKGRGEGQDGRLNEERNERQDERQNEGQNKE